MSSRLILRGGLLVNGRPDASPAVCDVLVEGERIAGIAPHLKAFDARVISARGLVVAPGFIDAHSHSDMFALLDSSAQGRVFDGVASEVNGTCGLSIFPLVGPAANIRRESLRKLGIDPEWTDAAGYFECVERFGSAINRAFMVGHGAIRAAVMSYSSRAAMPRDIRRMEALLTESLRAGAVGLSSGLCYAPGCYASGHELAILCVRLGTFGRPYSTHIRSEGHELLRSTREALSSVRRSAAPLHISHIKTMGPANWWKIDLLERVLFKAIAGGRDVTGDRYPYLAAATGLSSIFPDWLMVGGKERALRRLQTAVTRKKLRCEMTRDRRGKASWDGIIISGTDGMAREFEGLNMAQVATRMNLEPADAAFELLIRTNMSAGAIFFEMCEQNLERILKWPFICVGSDSASRSLKGPTAQGRPHPRTFGTFSRFISEYVIRRKWLTLPEGIARITSFPARRFGLRGRGILEKGAYADITVFDPKRLKDRAIYEKPFQLSTGVRHLIVNGKFVIRNGRQTAARPGRVLRAKD